MNRDQRGFFLEAYSRRRYVEAGITDEFVQDNHSRSRQGVLRGLHYQGRSSPMSKLVRCSSGKVMDVAVDLRVGSATFGKTFKVELSEETMLQLFVPVGFAHGFLTLSEWADVDYKCGGYYDPQAEGTILWNDPELRIDWPIREPLLSSRDASAPTLAQYRERPAFPPEP